MTDRFRSLRTRFLKVTAAVLTGSILLFRLTGCPAAEPLGEATVRVSAARVRAMPDLHSDILAKVNQGEKFRLLEKKKEWFRVEHAGGSGWVLGELIKIPENVFWRACLAEKTPAALRDYLKAYPAGKFAGAARSRLKKPAAPAPPAEAAVSNTEPAGEAALAGQIRSKATIENCERYLSEYPAGPAAGLARERLDPLRFREARETDWHSDYRAYLEQFPSGEHAAAARERLAWLAGRKAVPEIVVSAVVDADDGDVNAPGPRWRWTTQLYERGGQIGYRVSGQGFILDPRGGLWMGENDARIPRPRIRVEAGGSARDTYWISSRPHLLCNGVAIFTWEGEDAGGHPIRLEERIQLRHLNCPGPTPAR